MDKLFSQIIGAAGLYGIAYFGARVLCAIIADAIEARGKKVSAQTVNLYSLILGGIAAIIYVVNYVGK